MKLACISIVSCKYICHRFVSIYNSACGELCNCVLYLWSTLSLGFKVVCLCLNALVIGTETVIKGIVSKVKYIILQVASKILVNMYLDISFYMSFIEILNQSVGLHGYV